MSRRTRGLPLELAEELAELPIVTRRHPARFTVYDWTPEMKRQLHQAEAAGAPSSSEEVS